MNFFTINLIRALVFFSLANHGICQEQLPEPNKPKFEITHVSDKNEFESIISSEVVMLSTFNNPFAGWFRFGL